MARARKATSHVDHGMNLIQVMPFPALNPWNWWALASPHNAMLAAMQSTQAMLQGCRTCADAARAAMRQQQDAALSLWLTQTAEQATEAAAEAKNGEDIAPETTPSAAMFMQPMVEATKAYNRIGKAFIVAQRDTLRAFSDAGTTH